MNKKNSKWKNIRRIKTATLTSVLLLMLVCIAAAVPAPILNFVYPTPANNSYQTADFAQINVSIVEQNLDTFKFNWNGTNYTFYDDSLVFAMNLNNNSVIGENATHAVDISSYKNNGTLVNGPVWTSSGRFGSALDFDGSNDYVEAADSDSLDFGTDTDFTIESWIKADSGNNNHIVGKGDWGIDKGYYTRLFNGKLNARINDGTNSTIGSGNTNLVDDLWHHVTVVYDRDDKMRFYVDGALDGESASISSVGDINNDFTLRIASYPWGGWYFNGTIDEVRIYNRSLSATEIWMHYLSEFKRHNSTHWYFYDNMTGLPEGVHNYTGWAKDTSNNVNQTETRILTIDKTPLTFSQIDFYLDGMSTLNSDWGSVELMFEGSDDILYFNLVVDGDWQIQNVPVLSLKGTGNIQSQRFSFDLGNNVGEDVTAIDYAFDLTTYTLASAPSGSTPATVGDDQIVLFSGGEDVSLPATPAPAVPLIGGQAIINEQHKNENFPNQECGHNECAPTAVSNSLQFLNDKHNLGMNPADITIAKMKVATKWKVPPRVRACYIWDNPGGNAWWKDKKTYMEDNDYPITTRRVMPADIGTLIDEIDAGQDIEAELGGHTVCVVGITDLGGGRYSVTVASDLDQGNPGGAGEAGIETGTWNTTTGKWEGGINWNRNYSLNYFVVECPEFLEVNKTVWNPATEKWDTSRVAKVCDNLTFNCTIHAKCCNLTNITVTDILSCSLNYTNNATVYYPNGTTAKIEPEISYYPCNNTTVTWFFPGPLNRSETITITFDAHKVKCCNNTNTQYVTAWCNETNKWVNGTSNTVDIFCKKRISAEDKAVQPQDQFNVNITVDPACHCVYGAQYELYYNTSVVMAETQVKGPFLGDYNETIVVINAIDQANGIVSYAETRTENESGVTEAGILATIHFTAIGARGDIGNLNLSDVIIVDCNNTPNYDIIIENGTVEITNNIPPTAIGTSKHRINNVAKKYPCNTIICSCSYDLNYPGKGGNITYIQWDFGDGQYGDSEGLPDENNCTCTNHTYDSWQWAPFGDPDGGYVDFDAWVTVTDDGCPEETSTDNFSVTVQIAGDANGDGMIDILDAAFVGMHWNECCCGSGSCPCYPGPCNATVSDCMGYLWDTLQQDQADLNNDCNINVLDAMITGANWGCAAWG